MRAAPVLPDPVVAAPSGPLGPAVAWLASACVALALSAPPTVAAPAAAALALLLFRQRVGVGLVAAVGAALGACAEAGSVPLVAGAALALAAGALAAGAAPGPAAGGTARPDEVERHLARCRRTGAPADLVVASCRDAGTARAVAADLRISDSVRVRGAEVHAMLDRAGLDRGGFAARAARPGVVLGWARYPEDALTAGDLVDAARPVPARRRAPEPGGVAAPQPAAGVAALATAVADVTGVGVPGGPATGLAAGAPGDGPAPTGTTGPGAPPGAPGLPGA
jgi:hypothetical protein